MLKMIKQKLSSGMGRDVVWTFSIQILIMLCSFVVFRQIYLYIMANYISNTIIPIAMGYPAGWIVCSAVTLIYYLRADLGKSRLV
jgi:hypothetical protein